MKNSIFFSITFSIFFTFSFARYRGVSGDTSFGILERLDEVTERKPVKTEITNLKVLGKGLKKEDFL